MAYQVCPICKGEGEIFSKDLSLHKHICPVCKGEKIINEKTGKPPSDNNLKSSPNIPYWQSPYIFYSYTDAYKQPLRLD